MVSMYRRKRGLGKRRGRRVARRNYIRKARKVPTVHRYKESYIKPQMLVLPGATSSGRIACSMAELQNNSGFNTLYDLFKVTGFKVKLIPRINSNTNYGDNTAPPAGQQYGNNLPMLYIAPNRSPQSSNPLSAGDVLNDDQCRAIRFDKPITLYIRSPKPDVKLYSSADGSLVGSVVGQLNVGSKYQQWFPTAGNGSTQNQYVNMFWYGFRYWIDNTVSNVPLQVETIITEYMLFKEQD